MNKPPVNRAHHGLYLHVPFCKSKCPYCAFCSIPHATPNFIERVVRCLGTEMQRIASRWTHFDTVYVGGGSPSCINPEHLEYLVQTAKTCFQISSSAELTLEINPSDVSQHTVKAWSNIGFNRFSLGVQSPNADELLFLGRRHNPEHAVSAMEYLAEWALQRSNPAESDGVTRRFSVDLIAGIPGQTLQSWKKNLQTVLHYHPHHISCYQLTVEPGTPLAESVSRDFIPELLDRQLFELTHRILTNSGYIHYEISNYSLGFSNVSRHNLKYWFDVPYLGIGPSAHSFDGSTRWWNTSDPVMYCNSVEIKGNAIDGSEERNDLMRWNEMIFLQLRTIWGLDRHIPGDTVEALVRQGYLVRGKNRLVPTVSGMAIADHIACMLMES